MEHELLKRLIDRMFASYNAEQKESFLIRAASVAFSLKPSEYDLKRMRMAVATWYNAEIRDSGFIIDMSSSRQVAILNSNRELWINYDECEDKLIELLNAWLSGDMPKLNDIFEEMEYGNE